MFLFHLVLVIAFLLSEVLLQTSFLDVPYTYLLRRILPDVYGPVMGVKPHPYFASGLLFVAITTLLLVFASGMYSEKIAYANRYEPSFLHPVPSEHPDHEPFSKICPSRKQSVAVLEHVPQRPQAPPTVQVFPEPIRPLLPTAT